MSAQALSDEAARDLIAALDALDGEIETLQASKRDLLGDARDGMKKLGATRDDITVCIGAVKAAVAHLRKERSKPETLTLEEERDDLAAHFIAMVSRATRHAHVREADTFRSDARPSSSSPQDTGAKAGSGASGESLVSGPAKEDTRESANEAPRGDQGDGVVAATAAPSQSVEKVVPAATVKGDGPTPAAGPAADEAVGSNSPERASVRSVDDLPRTARDGSTGGDSRRDGTGDTCQDAAGGAPSTIASGVTAGERPGTLSPDRQARLEAYEAAQRANPKPLDPAHPLYEILLAAREGRKLGEPVEASA